jgi:hypothetical protein
MARGGALASGKDRLTRPVRAETKTRFLNLGFGQAAFACAGPPITAVKTDAAVTATTPTATAFDPRVTLTCSRRSPKTATIPKALGGHSGTLAQARVLSSEVATSPAAALWLRACAWQRQPEGARWG